MTKAICTDKQHYNNFKNTCPITREGCFSVELKSINSIIINSCFNYKLPKGISTWKDLVTVLIETWETQEEQANPQLNNSNYTFEVVQFVQNSIEIKIKYSQKTFSPRILKLNTWYPYDASQDGRLLADEEDSDYYFSEEFEVESAPDSETHVISKDAEQVGQAVASTSLKSSSTFVSLGFLNPRIVVKYLSIINFYKLILMYPIRLPKKFKNVLNILVDTQKDKGIVGNYFFENMHDQFEALYLTPTKPDFFISRSFTYSSNYNLIKFT